MGNWGRNLLCTYGWCYLDWIALYGYRNGRKAVFLETLCTNLHVLDIGAHDITETERNTNLRVPQTSEMLQLSCTTLSRLTVAEHLWFYACLKGGTSSDVAIEMEQMLKDLDLPHKRDEYSANLSGITDSNHKPSWLYPIFDECTFGIWSFWYSHVVLYHSSLQNV